MKSKAYIKTILNILVNAVVMIRCRPLASRLAFSALLCLAATQACATVYEISEDGTSTIISTPISAPAPHPETDLTAPSPAAARATPSSAPSGQEQSFKQAFKPYVLEAAQRYRISPDLIDAIAHTESRYNPKALSRKKALGIMQIMPDTAAQLGVNPADPKENILGGAAYLRWLLDRFNGDLVRAIAAYNAGPGAVEKAKGVPRYRETQNYVYSVLEYLSKHALHSQP